jgi:hypothetical protein
MGLRKVSALILLLVTMTCTQPADAQFSVGINAPGLSIGINLPAFPSPGGRAGLSVYYAPNVNANYFFYDGFYWVFNVEDGQWYSSSWYNGPWVFVEPMYVPQPLLVIPFRYYRVRPAYWSGWVYDAPPRWGFHWGRDWESRRSGWDRWDRNRSFAPAPLPTYQRAYPRDRYPAPAVQVNIHNERYTYQARDANVQRERAVIIRQQSTGGARATVRAERVEQSGTVTPVRDRQQRQEPARTQRQETTQPPAAPRQDSPVIERGPVERGQGGRRSEPQRAEPQTNAPREQAVPQQAPRRRAAAGRAASGRAPQGAAAGRAASGRAPQRAAAGQCRLRPRPAGSSLRPCHLRPRPAAEPQSNAPREQAAPQQAPRGERPARQEERQQERQERQQERQERQQERQK